MCHFKRTKPLSRFLRRNRVLDAYHCTPHDNTLPIFGLHLQELGQCPYGYGCVVIVSVGMSKGPQNSFQKGLFLIKPALSKIGGWGGAPETFKNPLNLVHLHVFYCITFVSLYCARLNAKSFIKLSLRQPCHDGLVTNSN